MIHGFEVCIKKERLKKDEKTGEDMREMSVHRVQRAQNFHQNER